MMNPRHKVYVELIVGVSVALLIAYANPIPTPETTTFEWIAFVARILAVGYMLNVARHAWTKL